MKRFKPSAKPCVNCRKIKSAHKRILGVLLCPKLLSRRDSDTKLFHVIYQEMEAPVIIGVIDNGKLVTHGFGIVDVESLPKSDFIRYGDEPMETTSDMLRVVEENIV